MKDAQLVGVIALLLVAGIGIGLAVGTGTTQTQRPSAPLVSTPRAPELAPPTPRPYFRRM